MQWVCGDDVVAKQVVMGLIADAGYAPDRRRTNEDAAVMEMPRRAGAVYGEEYRLPDTFTMATSSSACSARPW